MTTRKKGVSAPDPLVLSKLRNHFRQTYMLNEMQIEMMLVSSSKSLKDALSSADEIFKESEPEEQLVAFLHSLKGLLLNMGESEWASYIKAIESELARGEQFDHAMVVGTIKRGLVEILSYGENVAESGFYQEVSPDKSK